MSPSTTSLENNAAAQADGRSLLPTGTPINPLLGLALALAAPVLRFFRQRTRAPMAVRAMKLESYSASPVPATEPQEGSKVDPRYVLGTSPRVSARPQSRPPRRSRRVAATNTAKGGPSHG